MKDMTTEDFKELLQYVILFLITFLVLQFFIGVAQIPTASMEPTLNVGKKYLFFQTSYMFSSPKRGDIIVFDDRGTVYCKRIIGTPGDSLDFTSDGLMVNGELIDEPYAHGNTYGYTQTHYDVPEGEYFFMGDNRENSRDSRLWDYPFIKEKQILGRVLKIKK